jgi:hypothetical protein
MLHLKGCGIISNKTAEKMKATVESLKARLAARGIPILKLKKGGRCTHKQSNQNQFHFYRDKNLF